MTTSLETILLVGILGGLYLLILARKTVQKKLDIYDLIMLSSVVILPLCFFLLPDFTHWVSQLLGVELPLSILFGMLFLIVFVFVHRLTTKLHMLERQNRLLVQELSLLKADREGNV